MNISDFAEELLFGKHLENKLLSPNQLDYNASDAPSIIKKRGVVWPGRSEDLSFSKNKKKFPAINNFSKNETRAEVLHSFANHELLAIETMALTLLLFPDSPESFRKGLVGTIKDEQRHLSLYIERIRELGHEFGDFPLNDFFWKSMQSMSQPIDFTVRMSLMFEQANLDFADFYKNVFLDIKDLKTASLMQTVYEDEIRHVRHGLYWFDRWRSDNLSRWETFKELLPFPLTPQRAKGKIFLHEARRQSGLDDSFIKELETYSASKGRVPHLYLFWPDCEEEFSKKKYRQNLNSKHFTDDLALVPAFAASSTDAVLLPQRPATSFLHKLQSFGLQLPEILLPSDLETGKRRFNEFRPWGWSPGSLRWQSLHQNSFLQSPPELNAKLLSKTWSVQLMQDYLKDSTCSKAQSRVQADEESFLISPEDCGVVCSSLDEILKQVAHHLKSHPNVVVKAPYGSSGKGFLKLTSPDLSENHTGRLRNLLSNQKQVVVEPWLDKVFDYSLQMTVTREGRAKINGQARFLADHNGTYRGALLGGFTTGLGATEKRFLNANGRDRSRMQRHFTQLSEFIAERCHQTGYSGPVGIDALVFRKDGELRLKPIVETNCRYNMGRVIVELEKKLSRKGVGLWRIIPIRELEKKGFTSFENFEELAEQQNGIEFLRTTDPVHQKVGSYLFWANNLEELEKGIAALSLSFRPFLPTL